MLTFILVLGCLSLQFVYGADPANTAAGVGDAEVTLQCAYGATVGRTWSKGSTKLATNNTLENGIQAGKYEVATRGTEYTLKVKTIVIIDGDKYACRAGGNTKSARLVPIANPTCALADKGTDKIRFTCSGGYGGDWPPLSTMKDNANATIGNRPTGSQAGNTTTRQEDITVTVANDGHVLKCELVLHESNQPEKSVPNVAQNVPTTEDNKYKCSVTARKPASAAISPTGTAFVEGDTLTCTATGTPTPNIEWSDGTNALTSSNGVLTLAKDMAGKTLTCTASNNIGTDTATRDVTTVEATTAGPTTAAVNPVDSTVTQTYTQTSSQNSAIFPRFHGLGIVCAFMSALIF